MSDLMNGGGQKSRENRLRRAAQRQGLVLRKSRRRDRAYAILAQVPPFTDTQLEYGRCLLPRRPRKHDGAVDLGDDVVLAALRTKTPGTLDVSLGAGEREQVLPTAAMGTAA